MKNLLAKLKLIRDSIEYVQKDGKIEFGKSKYKVVTEGAILAVVRPLLVTHGVIVNTVDVSVQMIDKVTLATYTYEIIDLDSGESMRAVSVGAGHDSSDKGPGKAATYAKKYLFMKLFDIVTGEDPDHSHSDANVAQDRADKAGEKAEGSKAEKLQKQYVAKRPEADHAEYKAGVIAICKTYADHPKLKETLDTFLGYANEDYEKFFDVLVNLGVKEA